MNSIRRTRRPTSSLGPACIALLITVAAPRANAQPMFTIERIESHDGLDLFPRRINNSELVLGDRVVNLNSQATVWINGAAIPTGTPYGFGFSLATDVNELGQVVGRASSISGPYVGFLWHNGAMTLLEVSKAPSAINNAGQITMERGVWANGVFTTLQTAAVSNSGWFILTANDINDAGQVVGLRQNTTTSERRFFLWSGGESYIDLGTRGNQNLGIPAEEILINNAGQIIMNSSVGGTPHVVLWEGGATTDLGPHGSDPGVVGINNLGQIVTRRLGRSYLWENGVETDLLDSIAGGCPLVSWVRAADINDAGDILVTANNNGVVGANILRRCPVQCAPPHEIKVVTDYVGPTRPKVYFIDGVSFPQTFEAIVEWGDLTPGTVTFTTPMTSVEGQHDIFACRFIATLDVGSDFGPRGRLTALATSGDDPPVSFSVVANFEVLDPPPILNFIPSVDYFLVEMDKTFEYRILGLDGVQFDLANWEATQIDAGIPLFGDTEMKVGVEFDPNPSPFTGTLSGTISSEGKAELLSVGWDDKFKKTIRKGVRCRRGIKLPFLQFAPSVSAGIEFTWSDLLGQWIVTGELDLGADIKYSTVQVPLGVVLFVPIYMRAEVVLDLMLELGIAGWGAEGPVWSGSFDFEPLAKAILGAGVARVAAIEGYLGGGFHAGFNFLPTFDWIDPYVILVGGVKAVFGPFSAELPLEFKWPDPDRRGFPDPFHDADFELMPRDYLEYTGTPGPTVRGTGEGGPIETASFPYSAPHVVRSGSDMLLVRLADDPARSLINRTELTFETFNGVDWSASAPVADDGTADLSPILIDLPGGDAACVWMDADQVLPDTADMTTFLSHLEVSFSLYDASAGAWSAPSRLTSDQVFDRSARIAGPAADDILAVWVRNAANDLWGSTTSPNELRWSAWDGASWSPSGSISAGIGAVLDVALAYDGADGTLICVLDADEDMNTIDDRELLVSTFVGGAWSPMAPLTANAVADDAPRLLYDGAGNLRLAWLQGDDIRFAAGLDVSSADLVATVGSSAGVRDMNIALDDAGDIAIVWSDTAVDLADLWVATRDAASANWSAARQITADSAAERFVSPAFDSNGDLFCVFDRTETVFVDQMVEVDGQIVTISGVPEAGQSDLYYLKRLLAPDSLVLVEGSNIDPPTAGPGDEVTITALVRNEGERHVDNLQVAFYDGDPAGSGIQIGATQSIAWLGGGMEAAASVAWTVPSNPRPEGLFIVADPNGLVVNDRDPSNNTAVIPNLTRPDLRIVSMSSSAPNESDRYLVVNVANQAGVGNLTTEVVLRRDAEDGQMIQTLAVPVFAGESNSVAWLWQGGAPPPGETVEVFAIVDEDDDVDELDEENNSASLTLAFQEVVFDCNVNGIDDALDLAQATSQDCDGNSVPDECDPDSDGDTIPDACDFCVGGQGTGDADGDGDVDLGDYVESEACLLGPLSAPGQGCDCFDFNADGDSDLEDFAAFTRLLSP